MPPFWYLYKTTTQRGKSLSSKFRSTWSVLFRSLLSNFTLKTLVLKTPLFSSSALFSSGYLRYAFWATPIRRLDQSPSLISAKLIAKPINIRSGVHFYIINKQPQIGKESTGSKQVFLFRKVNQKSTILRSCFESRNNFFDSLIRNNYSKSLLLGSFSKQKQRITCFEPVSLPISGWNQNWTPKTAYLSSRYRIENWSRVSASINKMDS